MCNPVAIIAGAVEVGGQVAKHFAQKKAAKENKTAAIADMRLQYSDVNARLVEEQKAGANQIVAGVEQGTAAQGTALASAAGAGVGGVSVEALLNTIEGDTADFKDSVNENLDLIARQADRDKRGIRAGTTSRINSVQSPSILGLGVRIAGAGIDLYTRNKAAQPNNSRASVSTAPRNPNAVPGK